MEPPKVELSTDSEAVTHRTSNGELFWHDDNTVPFFLQDSGKRGEDKNYLTEYGASDRRAVVH